MINWDSYLKVSSSWFSREYRKPSDCGYSFGQVPVLIKHLFGETSEKLLLPDEARSDNHQQPDVVVLLFIDNFGQEFSDYKFKEILHKVINKVKNNTF